MVNIRYIDDKIVNDLQEVMHFLDKNLYISKLLFVAVFEIINGAILFHKELFESPSGYFWIVIFIFWYSFIFFAIHQESQNGAWGKSYILWLRTDTINMIIRLFDVGVGISSLIGLCFMIHPLIDTISVWSLILFFIGAATKPFDGERRKYFKRKTANAFG